MTQVMLVGNPNCGKTTLFNALTGDTQRVGNWSGVTVEKKSGTFLLNQHPIDLTDLPGVYSLTIAQDTSSQDALITAKAVVTDTIDCIINVIDACHLERHLYLTSQLLELGIPLIIVINMIDIANQQGITINTMALSQQLNCPVIQMQAHRDIGMEALKNALEAQRLMAESLSPAACPRDPAISPTPQGLTLSLPSPVQQQINQLKDQLLQQGQSTHIAHYMAYRTVEGDSYLLPQKTAMPDLDIEMANARYDAVHQLVLQVQQKRSDVSEHFTAKLDRIVLHRFWALPIFFGMMYLMFFLAIRIGSTFQNWFDTATDAIFVQGTAHVLQTLQTPSWLIALCANGIGKGINTTLTFIPVMACMYFFLSLLEASGYMARAAFVVDRIMRLLGLPGKSFVPMIVGFGCNVPAIMAARTLDSERDRILTVLMSPFMSCSARLAIYAVFVAAFFPTNGQNIVFALYLIGIMMAVFTGFLLRKTILRGQTAPFILELPAYHKPALKRLMQDTSQRLRFFVLRAGRFIIPVCILLGGLNALTLHGDLSTSQAHAESILSYIGQWLTPLFAPMGLQHDNWPATVGLLTGTLAKEVVVGSLNTLYGQMAHLGAQQSVYGVMYQHFNGQAGAFAYLLFILLYIPCVSTMAAIRQETNRKLMWFSITWSLLIAYATATTFYQLATLPSHPMQTLEYIGAIVCCIGAVIFLMHSTAEPKDPKPCY